jgi:hypothetical protein
VINDKKETVDRQNCVDVLGICKKKYLFAMILAQNARKYGFHKIGPK